MSGVVNEDIELLCFGKMRLFHAFGYLAPVGLKRVNICVISLDNIRDTESILHEFFDDPAVFLSRGDVAVVFLGVFPDNAVVGVEDNPAELVGRLKVHLVRILLGFFEERRFYHIRYKKYLI